MITYELVKTPFGGSFYNRLTFCAEHLRKILSYTLNLDFFNDS